MNILMLSMVLLDFATPSLARQTSTVHRSSTVDSHTAKGPDGFFLSLSGRNQGKRTEEAPVAIGRAASIDPVEKLNFTCVFFSHVPKTGGTTMRAVLDTLVQSRSQKLDVCYNTATCEWSSPYLKGGAWRNYDDFLQDRCQKNQIVYGHGVDPAFAKHHHIAAEGAVWIAMIREPMDWAISRFEHDIRTLNYNGSFDQWIQDGHSKAAIDNEYVRYFVGPGNSAEPLEKRIKNWIASENVLILHTEDYRGSVHALAEFLGASSVEEAEMIKTASRELNRETSPGSYDLKLSAPSSEMLKKDLEIAYTTYNQALHAKSLSP